MGQTLAHLTYSSHDLIIAIAAGALPPLLWLRFWLSEDNKHTSRRLFIALCFILGAIAVVIVIPLEHMAASVFPAGIQQLASWAAIEEIIKFLAMLIIVSPGVFVRDPLDYAMYAITIAMGFASFENTLYLLHPELMGDTVTSFLTGDLRFLGATLLHSVSSAIVGIALGIAWYHRRNYLILGLLGLILAIALHTIFNFFIIGTSGNFFLQAFGFLWVITIIIILIFEKLRRLGEISRFNAVQAETNVLNVLDAA